MRLKIEKLGPLRDSTVEIGDITLFLGPPNTGKSYTLKALYSQLFPLDRHALGLLKRRLERRLIIELEDSLQEDFSSNLKDLLKTIVKMILVTALLRSNRNIEEVASRLIEESRFQGSIKVWEDEILIEFNSDPGNIRISINNVQQTLHESLHGFVTDLIPIEDSSSVTLEPIGVLGYEQDFMEILKTVQKHIDTYSYTRKLDLEFSDLLYNISRHILRKRNIPLRKTYIIIGYLRSMVSRSSISVTLAYDGVRFESESGILEFSPEVTIRLHLHAPALIGIQLTEILKDIEPGIIVNLVDKAFNEMNTNSRLKSSIDRIINYTRRVVALALTKFLSMLIADHGLSESFRSSLEVEELRFIPFGRSMLILGVEGVSREPIIRPGSLHQFVEEFYPSVFVSYVYWASIGRSIILDGKLDERRRILLDAATPLLEGRLLGSHAWRLIYEDWRGSKVDLSMSSALVGEVSGIILPLLSVEGSSLVLVEEPEAQLHPSAQIAMALFLASLPHLYESRVVASTHSDLLAITLSQLTVQKPDKEWLRDLLKRLLPHINGIDTLAGAVAEAVESLDLRIYEFTREGRIKAIEPEDVLSREVPGISSVIDELTDWAFRLASYRQKPGGA